MGSSPTGKNTDLVLSSGLMEVSTQEAGRTITYKVMEPLTGLMEKSIKVSSRKVNVMESVR